MKRASCLAALMLALTACEFESDNSPVCRPGATVSCYCHTAAPGEKTCEPEGLGYADCICLPDAGIDGIPVTPDAGVDASPE